MRALPFCLSLCLLLGAHLAGGQEASPTPEEKQQWEVARQQMKAEARSEADVLALQRAMELLGAAPAVAEDLTGEVRTLVRQGQTLFRLTESPFAAIRQARREPWSEKQADVAQRLTRELFTALAADALEERAATYGRSASCDNCGTAFDWCQNYTDGLLTDCYGDVGDRAWCHWFYRQMLHYCLEEFNRCLNDCSM